jgi:hypothetical protein
LLSYVTNNDERGDFLGTERNIDFDRCVDFISQMIQLYGAEVMEEINGIEDNTRMDVVKPVA